MRSLLFKNNGVYHITARELNISKCRFLQYRIATITNLSPFHLKAPYNFDGLRFYSTRKRQSYHRPFTYPKLFYPSYYRKQKGYNFKRFSIYFIILATCIGGSGFSLYYVENIVSSLVDKTGLIAGEVLNSDTFKESSSKAANDLINNILNDPTTKGKLKVLIRDVLTESQDAIDQVIVNAAQSEATLAAARNLTEKVVKDICDDPAIHNYVGDMLLSAINTETSITGALKWIEDMAENKQTINALRFMLTDRILQDEQLIRNAVDFCGRVRDDFFSNKKTTEQALVFLQTVLQQPSLHSHLSQALWEVVKLSVSPRRTRQDNFDVLNMNFEKK